LPIRVDLHVHTDASPDSLLSPSRLLEMCRVRRLDGVAVTDHNRLSGALEVARLAPPDLLVIVGEEVRTAQGELLGFFLREEVPKGLGLQATARAIRAQGGLVGAPHPGDRWRPGLKWETMEALCQAGLLDFVEGRNGGALRERANRRAEEMGRRLGLPLSAGSDAHVAYTVGICHVVMPRFHGAEDFLAALAQGELVGHRSRWWAHFGSVWARLRRLWKRRGTR
jgi:predicted metal-dependent phosphoesterase TrpH